MGRIEELRNGAKRNLVLHTIGALIGAYLVGYCSVGVGIYIERMHIRHLISQFEEEANT